MYAPNFSYVKPIWRVAQSNLFTKTYLLEILVGCYLKSLLAVTGTLHHDNYFPGGLAFDFVKRIVKILTVKGV